MRVPFVFIIYDTPFVFVCLFVFVRRTDGTVQDGTGYCNYWAAVALCYCTVKSNQCMYGMVL